jgi:hypothetical protein
MSYQAGRLPTRATPIHPLIVTAELLVPNTIGLAWTGMQVYANQMRAPQSSYSSHMSLALIRVLSYAPSSVSFHYFPFAVSIKSKRVILLTFSDNSRIIFIIMLNTGTQNVFSW